MGQRFRGVLYGVATVMLALPTLATPAATSTATAEVPLALDQTTRISSYCTSQFAREERTHGIPKHLLLAISATESGRWNDKMGMVLPWPWTINADGKGYYFETKHEAVTAARRLMEGGANNLDVGCMQISLKHHPKAFLSLSDAFDPAKNVEYAAGFLKSNYEGAKSWTGAVGDYHSKTPARGDKYFGMVKRNWKKIITALGSSTYESLPYLRFAGLSPEQTAVDLADGYENEVGFPTAKSGGGVTRQAVSIRRLPRMKVIKVTRVQDMADATPTDAVLVIRPLKNESKAEYQKPQIIATGSRGGSATVKVTRAIPVEDVASSAESEPAPNNRVLTTTAPRRGPNFIFQ